MATPHPRVIDRRHADARLTDEASDPNALPYYRLSSFAFRTARLRSLASGINALRPSRVDVVERS